MQEISFCSTYRIPLTQPGSSRAKKDLLKTIASKYQNVLFPSGNTGYVRVSVRKRLDSRFEQQIKQAKFKVYQKFAKHNVPKTEFENSGVPKLDLYINDALKKGDYLQFGKQKS